MKKVEKFEIKNKYVLMNDEKNFFNVPPFYIGNNIYLDRIVRALSSNFFLHFCKKSIIQ